MSTEVSDQITRRSASNLALAFVLLPPGKRAAMSALYAFCREVDDIADEETRPVAERRAELARWRADVASACDGGEARLPVIRELRPFITEFKLPFRLFDDLIRGVEMDLDIVRYPDRPALERYCYHVASAVGLLSIEIFGYQDPRCREYADALGKALQLTNILRDVGGDATRGRIYLPATDLARFGVTDDDILQRRYSPNFQALAASVADQAREHFRRARSLLPDRDRPAMVAAEVMGSVYWRLLCKLERRRFQVLAEEPTRLGKLHKVWLVLLAWLRVKTGLPFAAYGN